MRPSFQPRLVNAPFDDPALYLAFSFRRQAILFDAGNLASLSNRDILKIDHVFVTHTHMDHFCGFDRILRLCLGRNKQIHFYGPAGFISNLESKLGGYQWNLVDNFKYSLVIRATEITDRSMLTQTYRCRDRFASMDVPIESPFSGTLLETSFFTIRAVILDHQIPCLGLTINEKFHVNILKPALADLGLLPGPWLKAFKENLFLGQPPETIITVPASHTTSGPKHFSLEMLAQQIARITTGQKVAYVTDTGFTPANKAKIIRAANHADHLFIEAAFLERDCRAAARKYHLTAYQAGYLAAAAHVKDFTVFHFSPRYIGQADAIYKEARTAFRDNQNK